MTATPMLDKVRKYAKDWGIKIVGDRSGMSGAANVALRPDTLHRFAFTHDGPGIFSIYWPTRKIVEPITECPKRRLATDSDTWYLLHEMSHILVNVDPEEVDEISSATLALDYYGGSYLGLEGWEKWMGSFTLGPGLPDPWGDSLQYEEWGAVDDGVHEALLARSLTRAVSAGLLTPDGAPTFNRSSWMPISMRAEQLPLVEVRL